MKEMKDFYSFLEGVEGHEDALSFIKEHNGKIADLEAKARITGKELDTLTATVAEKEEALKKANELVEASKGDNDTVEVRELRQRIEAMEKETNESKLRAEQAEQESLLVKGRASITDLLKAGGIDTGKPSFNDYLESNYGKNALIEDGKLVLKVGGEEKIGDAAIEHLKTARPDLVAVKEGQGSRPVKGEPKADKYAGLSAAQKLTYGMTQ
jgi:vacuolar-type H+-ATPase subunit I/STV1